MLWQVLGEGDDGEEQAAHADEEVSAERKAAEEAEKRKALYDIMTCMRDIRKRADRTDAMFQPLKESVSLLQQFGITLNDAVLQQLENAEHNWKTIKKRMHTRREQLTVLQQAEAIEIRRKSDAFGDRVEEFRAFFQKKAPFAVDGGVLKLEMVRGRVCGGAGGGRVAAAGWHPPCMLLAVLMASAALVCARCVRAGTHAAAARACFGSGSRAMLPRD